MTAVHILNYTIPIAFMIFFGFWLDRLCSPAVVKAENGAECEVHTEEKAVDVYGTGR